MKKILLTGATGFIGSNIYRLLINNGYEVDCIVRKQDKKLSKESKTKEIEKEEQSEEVKAAIDLSKEEKKD